MKFYLSSFNLGDKADELVRLISDIKKNELVTLLSKKKKIAYIPNACDYTNTDLDRKHKKDTEDMNSLQALGLEVEYLDLKNYFYKTDELRKKLSEFNGVFVRGGNTFILRQAMRLS